MGAGCQLGDAGQHGVAARGLDEPIGSAGGDVGAGEGLVAGPQRRRHTLACQRRGIDLDVVGRGQRHVGRHPIAGRQHDDVAHDDVGGVDHHRLAVAAHDHAGRQQVAQALRGPLGALFLNEREHTVDDDDHEDRHAQLRHAGDDGEDPCDPQHQGEEVGELSDQLAPRVSCRWGRKSVRAIRRESGCGVGGGQARSGPVGRELTDRHVNNSRPSAIPAKGSKVVAHVRQVEALVGEREVGNDRVAGEGHG